MTGSFAFADRQGGSAVVRDALQQKAARCAGHHSTANLFGTRMFFYPENQYLVSAWRVGLEYSPLQSFVGGLTDLTMCRNDRRSEIFT